MRLWDKEGGVTSRLSWSSVCSLCISDIVFHQGLYSVLPRSHLKTHLFHVFTAKRYLRPSIRNLELSVYVSGSLLIHPLSPS